MSILGWGHGMLKQDWDIHKDSLTHTVYLVGIKLELLSVVYLYRSVFGTW